MTFAYGTSSVSDGEPGPSRPRGRRTFNKKGEEVSSSQQPEEEVSQFNTFQTRSQPLEIVVQTTSRFEHISTEGQDVRSSFKYLSLLLKQGPGDREKLEEGREVCVLIFQGRDIWVRPNFRTFKHHKQQNNNAHKIIRTWRFGQA